MKNQNDTFNEIENDIENDFDFEELERKLEEDLSSSMSDLNLLEEDKKNIGNPDSLGKVIHQTVIDHVNNQITGLSAEEFIQNNNNLEFDPRNSAHIQTSKNFSKGKIAKHNTKINYQERHDTWQNKFERLDDGQIKTHKNRVGDTVPNIKKGARHIFDKGRPTGSFKHKTDMDHTVPAAEIIRDSEANAYLTPDEQVSFANSKKNLNEMNSSHNKSKSDLKTSVWLDNTNSNGQKPREIFNDLNEKKEKEYRAKDKDAREEYEKVKAKGKQRSIETGKQSQKEEIGRMGATAGKAIGTHLIMNLLKDLLTEVIRNLISWFKSKEKKINTFLDAMKIAIKSFVNKLKKEIGKYIKDALTTGLKVIVSAIFKPIGRIIRKFGAMISQGYKSIKSAISYLKNPENKNLPFSVKVAQIGKIVVAGLTAAGAVFGGQIIESGLTAIPVIGQVLAFEIPLIGSLASLIGVFMSAMVVGILGAIVLNWLDKFIAKRLRNEMVIQKIEKSNEILSKQSELVDVVEHKFDNTKNNVKNSIISRHTEANNLIEDSLNNITTNELNNNNDDVFDDMLKNLNDL